MRKPFAVLALSVAVLSPLGSHAHEGHAHKLMGTVTAVHAEVKHVEIKTNDGKIAAFYVTDSTKYLKGKTPASLADLKPGTRVVVEAKQTGGKLIASEVKLGVSSEKPEPESKPHH